MRRLKTHWELMLDDCFVAARASSFSVRVGLCHDFFQRRGRDLQPVVVRSVQTVACPSKRLGSIRISVAALQSLKFRQNFSNLKIHAAGSVNLGECWPGAVWECFCRPPGNAAPE